METRRSAQEPSGTALAAQPLEGARRLLHVLPTFAVGGIQIRLAQAANALGPRYRHEILSLDGQNDCAARIDAKIPTALREPPRTAVGLSPGPTLRRRAFLRAVAPDVVATYNWGAIEWALSCRLPGSARAHVHFEDGFGPDEADRRHTRRNLVRALVLRGVRVVVPSATLRTVALREWWLRRENVLHVPNGIDLARFDAAAARVKPLAATTRVPGETLIGVAAPLRREKNVARLLRAAAPLLREGRARILVAGDGPERPALEAKAHADGIAGRVHFLGALSEPEGFIAALDLYALTSDTEQMPLGVLEAMAASLPVAAVDVGDVKAMLAPENRAFVVPKADEEALSRALNVLTKNALLRASLGAANRARAAEAFSWERMIAAYVRLFEGS